MHASSSEREAMSKDDWTWELTSKAQNESTFLHLDKFGRSSHVW